MSVRRLLGGVCGVLGDRGESVTMLDRLGYFPNLFWPRSFNEKVARRKLRTPPASWSEYADKAAVRKHVAQRIGAEYLTTLHFVTNDAAAIRLSALPERFVLKATHGSGWSIFCANRGSVREEDLQQQCGQWLEQTFGVDTNESWYRSIPPAILVEELLEDSLYGVPLDYKFWVFHGRVEFVQVDFDRHARHTRSFYDRDWVLQPWTVAHPQGPPLGRPRLLGRLIEVAEALAVDSEFVRVDLYCPDDQCIRFGELTFAPGAGWERFLPSNVYDFRVGSFW